MRSTIRSPSFFELFECHAAIASQGARELLSLLRAPGAPAVGAARLRELRDEGGLIAGRCFEEVHLSFVTPLDRETIERLVRGLQGAVNMLEEAAARVELYQLDGSMQEAAGLAELLVTALGAVEEALGHLRNLGNVDKVVASCDRVAALAEEAGAVLRRARGRLFREEPDPLAVIKWSDVFDHLGTATARCRGVARVIERVAVELAA